MIHTYAVTLLVLAGSTAGIARADSPALQVAQEPRPAPAALPAQVTPLAEPWKQALNDPQFVRTRTLLAQLGDGAVQDAVLEDLALATGLWPASELPREQRVERWRRYRAGVAKLVDEQGPILIDPEKDHAERGKALIHLGIEAPHPAFLPLLRKLAGDGALDYYVRYQALTAISQTPHAEVLTDLARFIDDPALRTRACEQLQKLTRAGITYRDENPAGMRADWDRWIERNGRTFRYERDRVLIER